MEKEEVIQKLERQRDVLASLYQTNPRTRLFAKWRRDTEVVIQRVFGKGSGYVSDFHLISFGPPMHPFLDDDRPYQKFFHEGLHAADGMLQSMIGEIEEYWPVGRIGDSPTKVTSQSVSKVFVVHGHSERCRESVARFLEQLGLKPTILHEQPNEGRTILEKFVHFSEVAFAVVLLTGDDRGGPKAAPFKSQKVRARQNVILELGFFLGKLGREKVCALHEEGVEIPSDYSGVAYVQFDPSGAWKTALARELRHAGLPVDMNDVK